MRCVVLLLWSVLVGVTSCTQERHEYGDHFFEKVDKQIPRLLSDFSIPGTAIAFIENGEVVFQKGYGYANIDQGIKVNAKTGFNVGSISKVLTAWGVMNLVNAGKINLDEPVETYLTRWKFPDSEYNAAEVTTRRLLSHSAGLSIHAVSAGPPYDNLPTLEQWLNGENDGLGKVEIIIEPGSKPKYSGGGFAVCQLLIEEVSGQRFEDYMQDQVLDPLGMVSSSFRIDDRILSRSATPYDSYGETTEYELFTVQAGAGLSTTLEDFIRFLFASMLQHNRSSTYNSVLSSEMVAEMMKPFSEQMGSWAYGMGYQTFARDSVNVFVGHGGSNHGWQANFWFDPDSNDGFVVMTNSGAGNNICNPIFCEWINWKSGETPWNPCEPKPSIATKLKQRIDQAGVEDLSKSYMELRAQYEAELDFSESQLNNLGYYYLARKDLESAIAVFNLNAELFSGSYNVYDSYGEALLAEGEKEGAIANYLKSLEINPGNSHGLSVLNRLGFSNVEVLGRLETFPVGEDVFSEYAGYYQEASGQKLLIQKKEGILTAEIENTESILVSQSASRFQVLGSDNKLTFFTGANNQKGLWTKKTIWRKMGNSNSHQLADQSRNILVFRDNKSWGRSTDFEEVLDALDHPYDQMNSSSMQHVDLKRYDMVIVPGGQKDEFYQNYETQGDKFDLFVEKGGTLILELNGAEGVLSVLTGGVRIIPNKAIENEIIEPGHPIFRPLAGARFFEARYASMSYFQNVPSGAIALAVESEAGNSIEGRPTFLEYTHGRGKVFAASQCFHDRDGSGRGPLKESVISYALMEMAGL